MISMNVDSKLTSKLLIISSFICIIISAFIIINTSSTAGYEISIYEVYNPIFWFLVIIALFTGAMTILKSAYNKDSLWIFGVLVMVNASLILLLLPLIRNYFIMGREDVLTHIGLINNIIKTGYIGENMYPIEHILGFITNSLTGIPVNLITLIFPAIFYIFYIISSYMLFNNLFNDKKKILICLIFILIPLFRHLNTMFAPFPQSILLIPFILYSYIKSRDSKHQMEFTLLTILLSFFLVFFHPLTILFFTLIFLIYYLTKRISHKFNPISKNKVLKPHNLIGIIIIVFLTWQSYAILLFQNISKIVNWFIFNEGLSPLEIYVDAHSFASLSLKQSIEFILFNYGQSIIIGGIALLSIIYLSKKILDNTNAIKFHEIFPYLGFSLFFIGALASFLVLEIFGWMRIYVVAIIFAIMLVPIVFDKLIKNKKSSFNKIKILVPVILFLIIYFSVFNMYPSPIIGQSSQQVSKAELIGMETFFENRNESLFIKELSISQWRFNDALAGKRDYTLNINTEKSTLRYRKEQTYPTDHFGYDNHESISNSYKNEYLLLNDLAKKHYPIVFPEFEDLWRFTPEDFAKLKKDDGAQLIYSNGNLEVFFIGR